MARTSQDLRFSPQFAAIMTAVADRLANRGMKLSVSSGFRRAADQQAMQNGRSGKNPAARWSDHQLGNAVDINGTKTSSFPGIRKAFEQAGAKWGGDYRGRKDLPHFYIRPTLANRLNTAICEIENPRLRRKVAQANITR